MEEKDLLQDDFLKKMIGSSSLETPSAGFTERIMEQIEAGTVMVKEKSPFYMFLGPVFGIAGILSVIVLFFMTSDIPVSRWFPAKDFYTESLLPYLRNFADSMSFLTGNGKGISIPAMIIAAAILFFVVDLAFERSKTSGSRQPEVNG